VRVYGELLRNIVEVKAKYRQLWLERNLNPKGFQQSSAWETDGQGS